MSLNIHLFLLKIRHITKYWENWWHKVNHFFLILHDPYVEPYLKTNNLALNSCLIKSCHTSVVHVSTMYNNFGRGCLHIVLSTLYFFLIPLSHVQPEFSVSRSCETSLLNVLHFLFMCSGVRVFVVNGVTIGCRFG